MSHDYVSCDNARDVHFVCFVQCSQRGRNFFADVFKHSNGCHMIMLVVIMSEMYILFNVVNGGGILVKWISVCSLKLNIWSLNLSAI